MTLLRRFYIFSPFVIIVFFEIFVALGLLLNRAYYQKALGEMIKDSGVMYISGYMGIIIGTVLIILHNIWEPN